MLVDTLHYSYMDKKNIREFPTWEEEYFQLGRWNQTLDSMGFLGFLFGGLEFAQGFLGYDNVFVGCS
jgi:hypothetical protein